MAKVGVSRSGVAATSPGLRVLSLVLANIDAFAKVAVFRQTCGKSWRLTIRGRDPVSWAAILSLVLGNSDTFAKVAVFR